MQVQHRCTAQVYAERSAYNIIKNKPMF